MTSSPVTGRTAVRGSLVTSSWTLASRLLGFVRDALMVATFGMSEVYGAFNVAWIVPNLFRKLLGEGAVGAAIQPALARARHLGGEAAARSLYMRFHGFLAAVLGLAVAGGEAALWAARVWFAPASPEIALALRYAAILLPYALPICLTALATAPQHLGGRYLLPALAPLLLNCLWIAFLLFGADAGDAAAGARLALGLLAGGLLQWLLQWPGVRAAGFPLLPRFLPDDGSVRRTLRSFVPALAGLAAVQLAMAVDQTMVWLLVSPAANSYAYLANRLLQLPLALIGIAVATGTLPLFARLGAEGRARELAAALGKAEESALVLVVAAGAGLCAIATPAIAVLFEHGRFESGDVALLAATLRAYLLCLPAATCSGLLIRARQACGDHGGPARVAILTVLLNAALDALFVPRWGVPGAGIATALALTLQAALLARGLGRFGLAAPLRLARLPRLLAPGAAAGAASAALVAALGAGAATVAGLAAAIGGGAAAALAVAALVLPAELRELGRSLGRRG